MRHHPLAGGSLRYGRSKILCAISVLPMPSVVLMAQGEPQCGRNRPENATAKESLTSKGPENSTADFISAPLF